MADTMNARLAVVAAAFLAGACQTAGTAPRATGTVEVAAREPWRDIATEADLDRLERVGSAWEEALAAARRAGFTRQIAAEGPLLDPAAALPRAAPPPGSYRCRVIRIGAAPRARAYRAFNPFFCHVGAEGELLSITKQTGSERPGGYLWEVASDRLVFLGSMALGTEEIPQPYGEDPTRDMAGIFERVAPFRYRLVIPWPRGESKLDLIELVPAIP
ncbi:MAG: DUF4893 domain-containing protein [Allosphingosinicella sp.]|uniref:DUF4893 domain-containing protein n=1 Tax=Allosphingosinicella sp. TaxID=2823234 RepID=UPI003961F3E4